MTLDVNRGRKTTIQQQQQQPDVTNFSTKPFISSKVYTDYGDLK